MELRTLQVQSWQVAEDHGFHKAQTNMAPETLATYLRLLLTIGELSEAAEELRAGHDPTYVYFEYPDGNVSEESSRRLSDYGGEPQVVHGKPAGFGIELADALIRLCDLAEEAGVDLQNMAELKEAYNKTRPFMHGKTA